MRYKVHDLCVKTDHSPDSLIFKKGTVYALWFVCVSYNSADAGQCDVN